jgi:hypothetical protein
VYTRKGAKKERSKKTRKYTRKGAKKIEAKRRELRCERTLMDTRKDAKYVREKKRIEVLENAKNGNNYK